MKTKRSNGLRLLMLNNSLDLKKVLSSVLEPGKELTMILTELMMTLPILSPLPHPKVLNLNLIFFKILTSERLEMTSTHVNQPTTSENLLIKLTPNGSSRLNHQVLLTIMLSSSKHSKLLLNGQTTRSSTFKLPTLMEPQDSKFHLNQLLNSPQARTRSQMF